MLLVLVVAVLVAGGCAGGRGTLRPSEAEIAAWWVEDVCHGSPRDPDELRLAGGSPGILALAAWCGSPEEPGPHGPLPLMLAERRQRWADLRNDLKRGDVRSDGGLRAIFDAAPAVQARAAKETQDRAMIDALAITIGLADGRAAEAWSDAVARARAALDRP